MSGPAHTTYDRSRSLFAVRVTSVANASYRRVAIAASAAVAFWCAGPCWADRLYGYADERGVFNFSDAPSTPRHRLILEIRPVHKAIERARNVIAARNSDRGRAPTSLSPLIRDAAHRGRIDPSLIEAIAIVESGFNERARSPKGALGLMQLMPATAARFGVGDPLDPEQNLLGGARYLRELLDRFDSLPLALAAYNAGEAAVQRYGNAIPPYAETMRYVPAVLGHYDRLRDSARINTAQSPRVVHD